MTDLVAFRRPIHLPEIELVSVAYRDRAFPEHRHEEFVIGAVTEGAETLTVGGAEHLAAAGAVLRLRPGEPHSNRAVGHGMLRYTVLYMPAALLARHAPPGAELRFAAPVLSDAAVHALVGAAHRTLAAPDAAAAEQVEAVRALAAAVCSDGVVGERARPARGPVEEARAYLDAHLADEVSLQALSTRCGVSPFHLGRLFKQDVGVSPIAYRNQQRLAAARRLLAQGHPTAAVAYDLGFADQSHLTRHFQRIVGTSPARYADGVARGRAERG